MASRARAGVSERDRAALEAKVAGSPLPSPFGAALRGPSVGIIAELKRSSPSKGALNEGLLAGERGRSYIAGGAAALSVLTEPSRFMGSLADLSDARRATGAPLLRKDFITAPIQLLEARAHGASAVLLIARALPPALLLSLAAEARALGLESLVEVRDEAQLALALDVPEAMIGVNNRDLETLVIEDEVTERLIPLIPADRVAVYESGVRSREDVMRAASLGADAVLVGSILSAAPDGRAAVAALAGVPRRPRG